MSEIDVAAIRAALAKATPEPWCVNSSGEEYYGAPERSNGTVADAELTVLLRDNAEALLGALEQAEAQLVQQDLDAEKRQREFRHYERRGAVKALRKAARVPHNGAADFDGPRGRVHPQSLYNEGASPWLDGMADAIENGAEI